MPQASAARGSTLPCQERFDLHTGGLRPRDRRVSAGALAGAAGDKAQRSTESQIPGEQVSDKPPGFGEPTCAWFATVSYLLLGQMP